MYNLVIAGNCYDGNGFGIDTHYQVFYREANSISNIATTSNRQLTFNTNDIDHLGYAGNLPVGSPIYVDIWQGDANQVNVLRRAYKRFICTGVASIKQDMILDETKTVTTNVSHSYLYRTFNVKPNVISNTPVVEVTYYIYYDINIINDNNYANSNFKLVKTINKPNTNDLVINFTKGGTFKVVCEAVISNSEVSKTSEIILYVADTATVSATAQDHYLEWE